MSIPGTLLAITLLTLAVDISAQPDTRIPTNKLIKQQDQPHVGKKYLLAIGVPNYSDPSIDSLKFPASDALSFWDIFQKGYIANLAPENTKILINDSASYSIICDVLSNWLPPKLKDVKQDDMVFIYWSGHAVTVGSDQELFCKDTQLYDLDDNKLLSEIDLSALKNVLRKFSNVTGVKTFLIVDACRNKTDNGTTTDGRSDEPLNQNDIYLFSTAKNGHSYETSMLIPGSSVFTYFLVTGLLGGADKNRDNQVRLFELLDFLNNVTFYVQNVLKEDDFQVPQPKIRNSDYGMILTDLPKDVAAKYRWIGDSMRTLIQHAGLQPPPPPASVGIKGVNTSAQRTTSLSPRAGSAIVPPAPKNTGNNLYDSLLISIFRHQLVEPDGHSAYDYFIRLRSSPVDPKLLDTAKSRLYIALVDDAQNTIDNYLSAKLINTPKHLFEVGELELTRAISLNSLDDPISKSFANKILFLRARALAGSNDPNDWTRGLKVIDSSIRLYPRLAYLYHTKGILFSLKRQHNTAIQCFDTAARLAPRWIYPLLNLANEYLDLGEQQKSILNCQKIIQLNPSFSRAYSTLASNYESLGANDSAKYWDNYALAQDSSNSLAYLNLGRIYLNTSLASTHLPDSNAYRYLKLGALSSDGNDCLATLGEYFFKKGPLFYDSARYFYQLALQNNPFNTLALRDYSNFLIVCSNIPGADSLFISALKRSDYDYEINSLYRSFAFRTKSPTIADSIFQRIVITNNQDPFIFIDHSRQFEEIGNIPYARDILLRGTRSINNSVMLYETLALLYLIHYKYSGFGNCGLDSSIYYFGKAKEIDPSSSTINLGFSEAFKLKGYLTIAGTAQDLAVKDNSYILKSVSTNNDVLRLADHYMQSKNYDSAISYFQRSESITKDKFSILLNISRCYYFNGKLDSAILYVNRSKQYIYDDEDTARIHLQLELRALIDFDKQDYRKAASNWLDIIDLQDNNYDRLDEALCNYKASGQKKREKIQRTIYKMGAELDAIYQRKLSLEGEIYSTSYIKELTSFVSKVRKSRN